FSLNSLGMPNPGAAYYEKHLPAMAALAHDADKPLLVSVAGFTPHEYGELAAVAFDGGADAVELNLGCPNVWQVEQQKPIFDFDPSTSGVTYPAGATTERQKPIACFDPPLVAEILRCVESRVGSEARVAVKISPFSDPFALGEVAGVIAHYEWVKAVTTTNTFPNAFAYDDAGQPMISPGGGLAGLGGPALKPIGLGQVRQLRSLLPERIQIIGVGGVSHGRDVREYLRAGAAAVQIATAYLERYERVFSTLLAELIEATLG
ncbi:MAG: hypothetical protein Q7R39_06000, partial [Dehalococcoidia bacterium]|nr:hypothetical protein [Dehalococcoidia bacterium]